MNEWWDGLSGINQGFYAAAAFFSLFFVWQMVAALFGLIEGGESDLMEDFEGDASETMTAFKLVNVRSLLTFLTLFSWGGALYLRAGRSVSSALVISSLWGLAGMISVAGLIYLLLRLTHNGTRDLRTAVGMHGDVYLDIPENGLGEVRVKVSGIMSHVKARGAGGQAIRAGTPVMVTSKRAPNVVEVRMQSDADASTTGDGE